jgi:hypothetical protein
MDNELLSELLENGESITFNIYQQEKDIIGSVTINPAAIYKSLQKRYFSDELKTFEKKKELDRALEIIRNLPLEDDEFAEMRQHLVSKNQAVGSDEELKRKIQEYFQNADEKRLLTRLRRKFVNGVYPAMIKNIEMQIGDAFLQILSAAQMRAENEIRKELGLHELKLKEMRDFVSKPVQRTQNIILDIKHGGKRKKEGFVWRDEHKRALYEQVTNLPKIYGKPMWEYAYEELIREKFDYRVIGNIRKLSCFKDVPENLYHEAVAVWRKSYESKEVLPEENTAKGFAIRYALILLGYSWKKFSTVEKYFRKGKNLSE